MALMPAELPSAFGVTVAACSLGAARAALRERCDRWNLPPALPVSDVTLTAIVAPRPMMRGGRHRSLGVSGVCYGVTARPATP